MLAPKFSFINSGILRDVLYHFVHISPIVTHGVVLLLQLPVKVDFHLVVAGGGELPVHIAWVVGHPVADEDVRVEEEADHERRTDGRTDSSLYLKSGAIHMTQFP